jgi:hypothetical protein
MRLPLIVILTSCLLTLPAAAAQAAPPLCTANVIEQTLLGSGDLTQDELDADAGVNLIRCGDVTGDGATDVLFTLASGGTAGDTRFGVLQGNADGTLGKRILNRSGYKIGIARHNRRSFDVMQPHYRATDPNCCPSSFRQTRYTWTGKTFKAGKAKKLKKAPARFYRP